MYPLFAFTVSLSLLAGQPAGSSEKTPTKEEASQQIMNQLESEVFARVRALKDDSERLKELYTKHANAPVSTSMWQPLTSSKGEVRSQIDRLTETVEDVLIPESHKKFVKSFRTTVDEIDQLERDIAELKVKKFEAPEERLLLDPVTVTKYAIDSYIEAKKAKIVEKKELLESLREEYSAVLNQRYNINLDPSEVDILMARVDGDDIVRSSVAVGAIGEVLVALELILNESGENMEIAQQYYGIVVLARETLVGIWERHLLKYNNEWFPRLDGLEQDAQLAVSNNRAAKKPMMSIAQRRALEKNIEANEFTLEAIKAYRTSLESQQIRVKGALEKAKTDLKVARLTLETVHLSGDLLDTIRTSRGEFSSLMDVQLPEVRPFDNAELRDKYLEITSSIR